ncbi:broad substrate specificity ATP-binding cassette transporter ABCG2-like isoform X2 [Babylonia areolata]|uniref:broad substrate specificity ATP-binding cassette transporter ABCG2-like isoform X2 n=1 Tax=Babylonia areolata TaxID=304850 RepID=UPI003FD1B67C
MAEASEKDGLVTERPTDQQRVSHVNGRINYGSTRQAMDNIKEIRNGGEVMQSSGKVQSSVLTCHNISYDVFVKNKACCGNLESKRILNNIDAIFKPGMNAILGPTGSGKSSLLDVLAGRKDPAGLSGDLLIDGGPPPQNFKCMVGYVVQDDVVMGTLTVRENFQFSAALRLPEGVSRKEREARVDQIIFELGLGDCADTKVGNEFIRGVSGGERKRCNIGMELITQPPVLFLDEPTTGLDASTANAVMLLLQRLAHKGRTIVFSIHQPRYSIYRVFDSIVLLAGGQTVYHGPSDQALDYFESIGYVCEAHNNPPDFFLDIINGDSTAISNPPNSNVRKTEGVSLEMEVDSENLGAKLCETYQKTLSYSRIKEELTPIKEEFDRRTKEGTVVVMKQIEYATSFGRQFSAVSMRTVKNIIRSPEASILQLIIMVIFGLIVGAVYFQISDSKTDGIQNRVGAFFFIVMNQVFGNLSAVELFIKERAIFVHENVSGFYRVSAYFMAKLLCDVIPMRLLPVAVFSAICYFMIGFRSGYEYFLFFMLDLFLTTLSASAIGFFFSATVRIFAVANLLIALVYVFMMLFSGLLVNLSTMGAWLRWIRYLSIFRYSLNGLYINEMKDEYYCNNATACDLGNAYLEAQDIPYETTWDLWVNEVALLIFALGFFVLSYVQLRRLNKLR